jgi:hypothetical protein
MYHEWGRGKECISDFGGKARRKETTRIVWNRLTWLRIGTSGGLL